MLRSFIDRIFGTPATDTTVPEYRVALAALLVRAALSDEEYSTDEVAAIDKVLADRYALTPADATRLRTEGEALEALTGDTVHLTKIIKSGVEFEDRNAVAVALWRVVLADNARADEENAFMRLVVHLLGINDVDSAHARHEAAAL